MLSQVGNAIGEGQRSWASYRCIRTYKADMLSKIGRGGKLMQNGQDLFERLQYFVFFLEFLKVLCLLVKKGGNRVDGVTMLKALGKRMFGQFYARLLLVIFQSGLKERAQM